jgi:hypothetical protein
MYKQALVKNIPVGVDYDIGTLKIKSKIDDISLEHRGILIWGKFDEFIKINLNMYSLKAIKEIHRICLHKYYEI